VRADSAVDDGQHTSHAAEETGKKKSQRISDAQHPPAQRLAWQDLVNQLRFGLGHAPGIPPAAESAFFAAEGDQLIRVALLAAHTQEALLQTATGQLGVWLLLDEIG
jgi:hypothetical protein